MSAPAQTGGGAIHAVKANIVLFEDSAALVGIIIAATGVWLSHALNDPRIDGMASMAIGVVLATVAVVLAREAKSLLIGEGADPALVRVIWKVIDRYDGVSHVNHVRTIHSAPDAIFVAVSVDFEDGLSMGDGDERIETELKSVSPQIGSIYIRPGKREDTVVDDWPSSWAQDDASSDQGALATTEKSPILPPDPLETVARSP